MSTKIYAKNYIISEPMTNGAGFMRSSSLFAIFQDIADHHSSQDGYGNDMVRARSLTWVVANQIVDVIRMPRSGEEIVVKTWIDNLIMMFSPRHFQVETTANEVLIKATSYWALMNVNTREIVNPSNYDINIEGGGVDISSPKLRSPRPCNLTDHTDYIVGQELIDENGHVNNARYFDIVDDVLGEELSRIEPVSIVAKYAKEVLEGESLRIDWGRDNDKLYLTASTDSDDCFKVEMHLSSQA